MAHARVDKRDLIERLLHKLEEQQLQIADLPLADGEEIVAFLAGLGFNSVESVKIRSALRGRFGYSYLNTEVACELA